MEEKEVYLEIPKIRLIHKGVVLEHDNKKKTKHTLEKYFITDGLIIQLIDEDTLKVEEVVVEPAEEEEMEEEQEEE